MISLDGTGKLREIINQGKLDSYPSCKLSFISPESHYDNKKPEISRFQSKYPPKPRFSSQNGSQSPPNDIELRIETDISK